MPSYTKTNWENYPSTETPITASNLNKIEDAIDYLFVNGTGGGESLPVGAEIEFDGETSNIPTGWEKSEDDYNVYSTDEKQIGTWIDNKPIYRKVLNCGALPNNSDKLINVNVSNINNVINIYGIGISSSGTCFPLPYVYNNLNAQIELNYLGSNQQVRITTGQDRSQVTGYVTIEYTKTTD